MLVGASRAAPVLVGASKLVRPAKASRCKLLAGPRSSSYKKLRIAHNSGKKRFSNVVLR